MWLRMSRKKCTIQRINSKPVLLFFTWLFLLGFDNELLLVSNLDSHRSKLLFANFNNAQFVLYPLLGILMDIWSLRLKMMKLCAFATILGLLVDLVNSTLAFATNDHDSAGVLKWTAIVLFTIPFALYRANIIPLYMDQIMGSSSDEHSAVVYWHTFFLVLPVVIAHSIATLITNDSHLLIIQIATFVATLYILPCSYSNVPALAYENHPQLTNPIKVVYKVLSYAFRQKKNNRFRSALTFWEEDCPSRLDLGKKKYGGPFKEGEVEDVKTALRMLPILMCTSGHLTVIRTENIASFSFTEFFSDVFHFDLQLLPSSLMLYGTIISFILIHQLVLKTLCFPLIPTMLTRMGLGLVFALLSSTTMSLITSVLSNRGYYMCANNTSTYSDGGDTDQLDYLPLLYLLPLFFDGVSYFLIVTASLEFTVAQSPVHMRGLLIGLWYMFWGMGTTIKVNLYHFMQCQLYYFITEVVLSLVMFILYLILAKYYKLRVKNTVYNAHRIIEEKVMKNLQYSSL